jgi:GDP-4-dehydro-6-deoxy-D-mannose reductase
MTGCDLLVTGARGFVGRHVMARAREAGLEARAADGDLRRVGVAEENVIATRPRAVIHLAAAPRDHDPWVALADDVSMAAAVLRAVSKHAPGAPMLVAGSAAQYGMGARRRLTEQDPTSPVTAYGANKCVLERTVTAEPLRGGVRVIFTRSFNHVGPGQGSDAPVAQWVRQTVEAEVDGGRAIRTGDLGVVRDFLDVRDIADAYLSLVHSPAEGVVNVCSGVPIALATVVETVIRRSARPLAVEPDTALARRVDPPYVVGDPGRLHELTGWRPRISLDESVEDLVDGCRREVGSNLDHSVVAP